MLGSAEQRNKQSEDRNDMESLHTSSFCDRHTKQNYIKGCFKVVKTNLIIKVSSINEGPCRISIWN